MTTTHLIAHVSYNEYAHSVLSSAPSSIDHISTTFPDDVTRYPDGSLQMTSCAKEYYAKTVIEPIRDCLLKKAETQYPIKPGGMWDTKQMARMYDANIFEHRDIDYKGIKTFTNDEYKLFYHGKWTRKHLLSLPQNDIAFNGGLQYGCINVSVIFKNAVKLKMRHAYEDMIGQWIESVNNGSLGATGTVSFCRDAIDIEPFVLERLKGRIAQMCVDISQSCQKAINWLIILLIHFCKKVVISQIKINGITYHNATRDGSKNVWWW